MGWAWARIGARPGQGSPGRAPPWSVAPLRIRLGIMSCLEAAAVDDHHDGRKHPVMRGAAAGADGLRPRRMSSHPVDTSRALVARCLEFVTKDASSRKKASADLLTNR